MKTNLLKKAKGFTLIELLVVIGILGILAAALIATIDPFEQLKKGQDSNVQNAAVEFFNANVRYAANHNGMTWTIDAGAATNCGGAGATAPTAAALATTGTLGACITDLQNEGELKSGFTTATSILTNIIISGTSNTVTACFLPTSKSMSRNANSKYNSSGVATTGCLSAGGATACYWCTY